MSEGRTKTIPGTVADFSLDELIAEANREKRMRSKVYWGLISSGKMTVEQANRRTGMMAAIAIVLEQVKDFHHPPSQGGLSL